MIKIDATFNIISAHHAIPLTQRLDNLKKSTKETLQQCASLKNFLPKAIDFLKQSDNHIHSERIAHFLMGKFNYLPPGLHFEGAEIPPDVKSTLFDLIRTHRHGVFGKTESHQKTLAKLEKLNTYMQAAPPGTMIQEMQSLNNDPQTSELNSPPSTKKEVSPAHESIDPQKKSKEYNEPVPLIMGTVLSNLKRFNAPMSKHVYENLSPLIGEQYMRELDECQSKLTKCMTLDHGYKQFFYLVNARDIFGALLNMWSDPQDRMKRQGVHCDSLVKIMESAKNNCAKIGVTEEAFTEKMKSMLAQLIYVPVFENHRCNYNKPLALGKRYEEAVRDIRANRKGEPNEHELVKQDVRSYLTDVLALISDTGNHERIDEATKKFGW